MAPIWFPLILYSIIDIHVFLVIISFGCIEMDSCISAGLFWDIEFLLIAFSFPLEPQVYALLY